MKSKINPQDKNSRKKYKPTFIDWLTVGFIAAIIIYLLYIGTDYFYEHYALETHHHHHHHIS